MPTSAFANNRAGGEWEEGWHVEVFVRQSGNSAGTKDAVRGGRKDVVGCCMPLTTSCTPTLLRTDAPPTLAGSLSCRRRASSAA